MSVASKKSILVVGCGSIGERHLRCFLQTKRATVTACDTNPALLQRMAATYQVPTVSDWAVALASGAFQAAIVCTPAPFHVPIGQRALEAGVHVLIEKPLSNSLAGVAELLRARDRSRGQAAVGYTLHGYPVLVAAKTWLARAELGRIRQVVVTGGQPFHLLRPGYAQSYYRDRKSGGGAIQDALTHSVNWVESVVGPADSVLCDCAHQLLPGVEVEDTVHVSARHGDILANYTLNQFQPANETTIQFNAERGSVKIEFHRRRWGVFAEGATDWTWHEIPAMERDGPFLTQAHAFLDQLEGRPSTLCSLEAGAQTLRFNLAALASAQSGTRVHCRDLHE
ncbi:MAG: Gfo/Idh/MocA family oxidoreductase [Verrucomicrobia bacterium]|nr:Gfo/Idh/MocA family oxidoreductase [Verrucomicrobiota bacterium]